MACKNSILRRPSSCLELKSNMADKTLRELQSSLPWTAHYHRDFRSTPMTHKDFAHALLHIHKAGGKLAAIIDEAEHAGFDWADPEKRAEVSKYVADMVICALRMATTCPDGQLDLQRIVEDRLAAKNNQLAAVAPTLAAAESEKPLLKGYMSALHQSTRDLIHMGVYSLYTTSHADRFLLMTQRDHYTALDYEGNAIVSYSAEKELGEDMKPVAVAPKPPDLPSTFKRLGRR